MTEHPLQPYRLPVPIPEVFLIPDFVTVAEESYLSQKRKNLAQLTLSLLLTMALFGLFETSVADLLNQVKTDEVGNSNMVIQSDGSISVRPGVGWQNVKHRRSMYWGGTLTAKGSLIPQNLPTFMNLDWPNIFDRISILGVFSESTCNKTNDQFAGPNHCLVNEYLPSDGILPHQDGPAYFPTVATLSLDSHTVYDFHSYLGDRSVFPIPPIANPSNLPALVIHPPSDQDSITSPADAVIPGTTGCTISPDPIFSLFVPRRSLIIIRSRCYTDLLHAIPNRPADGLIEDLSRTLNWDPTSDLHLSVSQLPNCQLERARRISLTCRRVKKVIKGLSRFGK